jgi:hypothetical protein
LTDIFEVQDEVVERIVGALAVTLTQGEQQRLRRHGTSNAEALLAAGARIAHSRHTGVGHPSLSDVPPSDRVGSKLCRAFRCFGGGDPCAAAETSAQLRTPRRITWPIHRATIITSLAIARAQFLYEQRLRAQIDKLDETLRSFRNVERAKGILMEKRKLDEEPAYHFMRRQAMNQRVSMGAVAVAIIDSHDILG